MMRNAVLIAATVVSGLFGQQPPVNVVPLPIINPVSVAPKANVEPLTPADKAQLTLRNIFGPRAVANRLLVAGLDQWKGHPYEFGGGMEGFGTRFGSRMGRLAARNSVRLATDVAFGIDPRYDRCLCSGFWRRTAHAWKRIVVSRSDSGSQMPAFSNFTGAYVTPMITYTWYPDRLDTWNRKLQSGTTNLTWRGVTNMIREFWPDIKKRTPIIRDE